MYQDNLLQLIVPAVGTPTSFTRGNCYIYSYSRSILPVRNNKELCNTTISLVKNGSNTRTRPLPKGNGPSLVYVQQILFLLTSSN